MLHFSSYYRQLKKFLDKLLKHLLNIILKVQYTIKYNFLRLRNQNLKIIVADYINSSILQLLLHVFRIRFL